MESKNEQYSCVIAIVNNGYTDLVMESAKKAGARGGTVISGRGTGNKDIEQFFGVVVTPEKEIVLILVPTSIRDNVLKSINIGAGMNTKGQGIAFTLPISDVVGLNPDSTHLEVGQAKSE